MFSDGRDDDASFQSLASNVRSRIDNAFYSASLTKHSSAKDVLKVGLEYDVAPAGFLLDDDDNMAGGFLPPSPPAIVQEASHEPEEGERPSYISLSRIPYALQLLDLPPDDEEVLAVFRSAATGWGDDHPSSRRTGRDHRREAMVTSEEDPIEEHVGLRDWRAVCAALMVESEDDEAEKEECVIDDDRDEENMDADTTGQDVSSGLEESGETSDEYRSETRSGKRPRRSAVGPKSNRKAPPRRTRSAAARRRSPLSPSASAEITPRQQRECLQTFLLFFPGVPEEVAKHRRLGVRELNAAATVLNEKIKQEEVVEMVEAFSTSPDKTMNLADFEKMMIATRLA